MGIWRNIALVFSNVDGSYDVKRVMSKKEKKKKEELFQNKQSSQMFGCQQLLGYKCNL